MKTIIKVPNDVLTTKAKPVKKIDKKILKIVENMKKSLKGARDPKGVGLAAPQIGISLRIFIMMPKEKEQVRVCINPEIVKKSKSTVKGIPSKDQRIEGCLSIPAIWGEVKRHETVTLSYLDEKGNNQMKRLEGFEATIAQHETDHVNGILFTHRVIEQKGKLFEPKENEKGEIVLSEIEL